MATKRHINLSHKLLRYYNPGKMSTMLIIYEIVYPTKQNLDNEFVFFKFYDKFK